MKEPTEEPSTKEPKEEPTEKPTTETMMTEMTTTETTTAEEMMYLLPLTLMVSNRVVALCRCDFVLSSLLS